MIEKLDASASHSSAMSQNKVVAIDIPPGTDPQAHEDEHVHGVYEQIASHFASTRYKVFVFPHEQLTSLPNKALAHHSKILKFNTARTHRVGFWHRERKVPAVAGPFVPDNWVRQKSESSADC